MATEAFCKNYQEKVVDKVLPKYYYYNMSRIVIQTPVTSQLRVEAERAAREQGYSSLQDAIRMYLRKLARREIKVQLQEQFPPVQLSPKAIKRYDKMTRGIISGRTKLKWFDRVDDLISDLNS